MFKVFRSEVNINTDVSIDVTLASVNDYESAKRIMIDDSNLIIMKSPYDFDDLYLNIEWSSPSCLQFNLDGDGEISYEYNIVDTRFFKVFNGEYTDQEDYEPSPYDGTYSED